MIYNYRFITRTNHALVLLGPVGHVCENWVISGPRIHYSDVIMSAMIHQIIAISIVLLNRLFRRRSKKASKLRVTGLCEGNSPVTSEFPTQMASNAENVSIWRRHIMYYSDIMLSQADQPMTVKFSSAWKLRCHWSKCWRQCQIAEKYRILVHISRHDVMKWKQFPLYVSFVREIYRLPVDSLHKGPVMRSIDFPISLNKASSTQ